MSYNVTAFNIKKLDNLTLPYAAILEMSEGDVNINGDILTFDDFYASGMEIVGVRHNDRIMVSDIHYSGEGSGTGWDDFEALLKQSTGALRVLLVWEGGDTIEMLTVEDGIVLQEPL